MSVWESRAGLTAWQTTESKSDSFGTQFLWCEKDELKLKLQLLCCWLVYCVMFEWEANEVIRCVRDRPV